MPQHESSSRRNFHAIMPEVCGWLRTVGIILLLSSECSLMIIHRFWRIFWVDATNAKTMELSLQDFAHDPEARASGVEHSAKSVLLWLSRIQHDWLLVFDNVDGDYNRVAQYMPHGNRGNILFNS
jgi:hypothetical protein